MLYLPRLRAWQRSFHLEGVARRRVLKVPIVVINKQMQLLIINLFDIGWINLQIAQQLVFETLLVGGEAVI